MLKAEKGEKYPKQTKLLYDETISKGLCLPHGKIKERLKDGTADFAAFLEDNNFVGSAYILVLPKRVFVSLLAVKKEYISREYIKQIITFIKEKYKGKQILLCIRSCDNQDDETKLKRDVFYRNNDFVYSGFRIGTKKNIFSNKKYSFDILVNFGQLTEKDIEDALVKLYGQTAAKTLTSIDRFFY